MHKMVGKALQVAGKVLRPLRSGVQVLRQEGSRALLRKVKAKICLVRAETHSAARWKNPEAAIDLPLLREVLRLPAAALSGPVLVDVVMPVHGDLNDVLRCLRSILAATDDDFRTHRD